MSREQLTEQTQSDAAAPEGVRDGDIQGLPPHLFGQVMKVKPGDAAGLVALLRLYPPYADRILAAASSHVGLSTIKQAQAMMPQETVGAAGSLGSMKPGGEFDLESSSAVVPQIKYTTNDGAHMEELGGMDGGFSLSLPDAVRVQLEAIRPGNARALCDLLVGYPQYADAISYRARDLVGVETLTKAIELQNGRTAKPDASTADARSGETSTGGDGGEGKPAQDAKWLAGARAYNAAHAQFVSKFLDIMKDPSMVGADGQIDPQKVAAFQQAQGIDADGRVGPQTVTAAQKYMDAHPNIVGFE
ncbi:MAG TPA: peptidoglycan-binding domain-containing protein [Kofleriaceae bacterium]